MDSIANERRPSPLHTGLDNVSTITGYHQQHMVGQNPDPQRTAVDHRLPPSKLNTLISLPSIASFDNAAQDVNTSKSRPGAPFRESSMASQFTASLAPSKPVDHIGGLTCVCSQMKPLIIEAGQLVRRLNDCAQLRVLNAEYDEYLQPIDASLASMQWIIHQLRSLESSLGAGSESALERGFLDANLPFKRVTAREPITPLERPMTPSKRRRRSSVNVDDHIKKSPAPLSRRLSPPLQRRDSRSDIRPSLPHATSSLSNRLLPSPSSTTVPTYTASIQRSYKASSTGSPPTSTTSGPSLHNAPMTSATSEYIADLQHQVTLKSLALQSLQAEHTNLLQRMHRETVKFQAIEKKSHVADHEINELSTKNDELTEQIKELSTQIAEMETRREDEGQAVAREKEQWGRMLDMSGRLQRKAEEDRRLLQEETSRLDDRISWYERRNTAQHQGHSEDEVGTYERHGAADKSRSTPDTTLSTYKAQIDLLRSTLEMVKQQHLTMSEQARDLQSQRDSLLHTIDLAIKGDGDDQAKAGSAVEVVEASAT